MYDAYECLVEIEQCLEIFRFLESNIP